MEEVGLDLVAADSTSMAEVVVVAAAAADSTPLVEPVLVVDCHSSVAVIHLVAADESASTTKVAAEPVAEVRTCHSCEISYS